MRLGHAVHSVRLIRVDDRSAPRRELCNIALFRPTFSAFDFPYLQLNTGSLALSYVASTGYLLLLICNAETDVYLTLSSGDGAGIC